MKIANKIVTALLAVAVFPVLITQTFVTLVASVNEQSMAYSILRLILGKDNKITGNRLGFEESIVSLIKAITGKSNNSSGFNIKELLLNLPEELNPVKKFVIASMVFIAIGLFIAVIIIGCTLFTKAYKTIAALGLGGTVSFLMSIVLFSKGVRPIVDGTIDVSSIIASALTKSGTAADSIANAVLTDAVQIDSFALGGAVFGALIIMLGIAMWEFAYVVTLPKEEKQKKKKA